MITSKTGLDLIKKFEGLKLNAYKCPAGVWTIGYGTTHNVKEGDSITEDQATIRLIQDVKDFEHDINNRIKVPINQNQFDALISFWYNCGGSNEIIKLINSNSNREDVYRWWISHYITGGGKVLTGLKSRRLAEATLFIS